MLELAPAIDAELAVLQLWRSIPSLTALCPTDHMGTELRTSPVWPWLLISLVTSDVVAPGVEDAVVAVDAYATTKRDARRLIGVAGAVILAIANDRVPEGLLCAGSQELGPAWLPDPLADHPVPRYTARYRVLTKH